jgi:hypothetical protein
LLILLKSFSYAARQPRGEEFNDEPQASVTISNRSNFGYIVLGWMWGKCTYHRIRSSGSNVCTGASSNTDPKATYINARPTN